MKIKRQVKGFKRGNKKIHNLVAKEAQRINNDVVAMLRETDLTDQQIWLVYGRIIQLVFQSHFEFAITSTDQYLKLNETRITAP